LTLHSAATRSVMSALGSAYPHPEGLFFPDTYRFANGASDLEILQLALCRWLSELDRGLGRKSSTVPLSDAVRGADPRVDRREGTALPSRTPANGRRIHVNRLRKAHATAIRPDRDLWHRRRPTTATYAKSICRRDTPYNTYTRSGLPPTPIALPGARVAARSGAPQETGDDLLRRDRQAGRLAFLLATYEEHQRGGCCSAIAPAPLRRR
jgi:UPF0755 protein